MNQRAEHKARVEAVSKVFAGYNIPVTNEFIEIIIHKYFRYLLEAKKQIKTKEQVDFKRLLSALKSDLNKDFEGLTSIKITYNKRTYAFKSDQHVMAIFGNVLEGLTDSYSENDDFDNKKYHPWKQRVSKLHKSILEHVEKSNLTISTRQLHLLKFDLLSIFFSHVFIQPTAPNRDARNRQKFAKVKAILR